MTYQTILRTIITVLILLTNTVQARGIVEMAVFKVTPGKLDGYLTARAKTMATISRYPGFKAAYTFRAIENPLQILDYVIWETYEDAFAAAHKVMADPKAMDMMTRIQSIQFYGHSHYLLETTDEVEIKSLTNNQQLKFRIFNKPLKTLDQSKLTYINQAGCYASQPEILFYGRSQFINERTDFVPIAMLNGESRQYFMDFIQLDISPEQKNRQVGCDEKQPINKNQIVIDKSFVVFGDVIKKN